MSPPDYQALMDKWYGSAQQLNGERFGAKDTLGREAQAVRSAAFPRAYQDTAEGRGAAAAKAGQKQLGRRRT